MRKFLLAMLALVLASFPAFAQDDMMGDDSAFVRAAHLSIDTPTVDIYVNGELTVSGADFGDVSDWFEVPAGSYEVAITAEGGSVDSAVLTGNYDLAAGDWATIAAIGNSGLQTLELTAIVEDYSNIADTETRISVLHAFLGAGPVDVFANGTELVRLLAYPGSLPEADGFASVDVVAGTYTITVNDNETGAELLSLGDLVLGIGRAYFVAVVGAEGAPQFVFVSTDVEAEMGMGGEMMPTEEETGTGDALARIGHFSASAPAVDVYVDGQLAVSELSFSDVTDYVTVPGGIREVSLVPAGEPVSAAVYTGEIAVFEGTTNLIAATGFVGDNSLIVSIAQENNEPLAFGETRVSFFQSIPSLDLFDLTIDGSPIIQGVTYPDAFVGAGDGYASVDVVAATYQLGYTGEGASVNVGDVTTGAGRHYLVVAVGTTGSPTFVLVAGELTIFE